MWPRPGTTLRQTAARRGNCRRRAVLGVLAHPVALRAFVRIVGIERRRRRAGTLRVSVSGGLASVVGMFSLGFWLNISLPVIPAEKVATVIMPRNPQTSCLCPRSPPSSPVSTATLRTAEVADYPGAWNGLQVENSGAVTQDRRGGGCVRVDDRARRRSGDHAAARASRACSGAACSRSPARCSAR